MAANTRGDSPAERQRSPLPSKPSPSPPLILKKPVRMLYLCILKVIWQISCSDIQFLPLAMNECYNAHKVILCPEFDLAIIAPIPNLMTHFAVETNFLGEKSGDLATSDQCQTHQRQTYLFIWIVFSAKYNSLQICLLNWVRCNLILTRSQLDIPQMWQKWHLKHLKWWTVKASILPVSICLFISLTFKVNKYQSETPGQQVQSWCRLDCVEKQKPNCQSTISSWE